MANDNNEESVVVELKNIPVNGEWKVKLKHADAIKTGSNSYGDWYLWIGEFEDVTAKQGRKPNQKTVNNYSGEALFFPTPTLHEKLIKSTNGNENVEVLISKKPDIVKDNSGNERPIIRYEARQVSEGVPSKEGLTDAELQILSDAQALKSRSYPITEEIMIQQCGTKGISEERAKEIFQMLE